MPKFFIAPQDVTNGRVRLTGENEKHIKTVLRAKCGEEITLCDGMGMDYFCKISLIIGCRQYVKYFQYIVSRKYLVI